VIVPPLYEKILFPPKPRGVLLAGAPGPPTVIG
jgi:hypothetical protein